jgi:glucosamine-phosphate N-acetyltransferase
MSYHIRHLEPDDYNKNYLLLLQQLSVINPEQINSLSFNSFVNNLHHNHLIYVIEDFELQIIIGTITILFEPKLIHTLGTVCHIEDVVIDSNYRGLKLSTLLLNHAIQLAKQRNCYKIILNCADHNIPIYTARGFSNNGNAMSLYLN